MIRTYRQKGPAHRLTVLCGEDFCEVHPTGLPSTPAPGDDPRVVKPLDGRQRRGEARHIVGIDNAWAEQADVGLELGEVLRQQ